MAGARVFRQTIDAVMQALRSLIILRSMRSLKTASKMAFKAKVVSTHMFLISTIFICVIAQRDIEKSIHHLDIGENLLFRSGR